MICVNEERHEPLKNNGFKHCLTAVAIRFELVRKGYVQDGTCQTKRKKNHQKSIIAQLHGYIYILCTPTQGTYAFVY